MQIALHDSRKFRQPEKCKSPTAAAAFIFHPISIFLAPLHFRHRDKISEIENCCSRFSALYIQERKKNSLALHSAMQKSCMRYLAEERKEQRLRCKFATRCAKWAALHTVQLYTPEYKGWLRAKRERRIRKNGDGARRIWIRIYSSERDDGALCYRLPLRMQFIEFGIV